VPTTAAPAARPSPTLSPAARRTASPPAATRSPRPSPRPSPTRPKPSPTHAGKTYGVNEVAIDRFSPSTLTIRVGDTVLATNKDSSAHTFTVPALGKDSGNMDSGETYRLTFTRAGTFHFVCTYHDSFGMNGDVTVKP
jgi:plastocyanin